MCRVVTFDTRTTDIAQSRNIAQLHYQIHNCDEILAVSLHAIASSMYQPFTLLTTHYHSTDLVIVDDPLPSTNSLCYLCMVTYMYMLSLIYMYMYM
jgi:hypothetical protein